MSPSIRAKGRLKICVILLVAIPCNIFGADLVIPRYVSTGNPAFTINLLALGVLIGLLAYTLFLAFSTREAMFVYFSAIMVLLTILQTFSAYDRFIFSLTYNRVTIITHLLFITFLLFFEDFFSLSKHAATLSHTNHISIFVIAAYTLFFLLAKALFPQAPAFHAVLDFIRELFVFYTNIIFILTIIRALKWMRTEAMLILIAFIPPALLTSINALQMFPFMSEYGQFVTFLMTYNQPIGLSLQAILFSLAMGNRYNRIRSERQQTMRERDRLKELDAHKTEFFMNMSHELRTPLTIILGMVQQARQGRYGQSIHCNDRIFETIERNSLRLLKQVDHLLRLEKGPLHTTLVPLPIGSTLKQVVDEFLPIMDEKHLSCTLYTDGEIGKATLMIAMDEFETLLMNLLSNAVKFTPSEGTIKVIARRTATGNLSISVQDTGIGIEVEQQQRIFNRYYRIPGSTEQMQTGLGLSLVKSIMDRIGGDITVESTPGKGSSFTLEFPSERIGQDSLAHNGSEIVPSELGKLYTSELQVPGKPVPPMEDKGEHTPRILVVEDNRDMVSYIFDILGQTYRVAYAENGSEGLRMLKQMDFDLIVCDIMMPKMDGHRFLSELKSMFTDHPIPLIFLTARDSVEEKIDSLREGAVHYLTKPFSPEVLMATIATTLVHDREVADSRIDLMKRKIDAVFDEIEHPQQPAKHLSIEHFIGDHDLSEREAQVLRLLLEGKSDKEIAKELDISARTVANHNRHLYRKARVGGRYELIARFYEGTSPVA